MEPTQQHTAIVTTDQARGLRLEELEVRRAEAAGRYMPVMSLEAIRQREAVLEAIRAMLAEGQDYGTIPGAPKPALYHAGAQKVCAWFGYAPAFDLIATIEDWTGEAYGHPLFYYHVRCDLYSLDNVRVGQGNGSCNSWEKKYRYRNGERTCPSCGKPGTIIKGNPQYERDASYLQRGAWLCFGRKGGCGAKFYGDDAAITNQETGRVDNPDFADTVNTIRKMADKRAMIAAVLNTTGLSQFFTQDDDAIRPAADPAPAPAAVPPPPAALPATAAPAAVGDRAMTGAEWKASQPTLSDLYNEAQKIAGAVGAPVGTKAAAQAVAAAKLAGRAVFPKADEPRPMLHKLPANITKIEAAFEELRPRVSDRDYQRILADVGGPDCLTLRQLDTLANYQAAYDRLVALVSGKGVAA